jgi:hypothetical protein
MSARISRCSSQRRGINRRAWEAACANGQAAGDPTVTTYGVLAHSPGETRVQFIAPGVPAGYRVLREAPDQTAAAVMPFWGRWLVRTGASLAGSACGCRPAARAGRAAGADRANSCRCRSIGAMVHSRFFTSRQNLDQHQPAGFGGDCSDVYNITRPRDRMSAAGACDVRVRGATAQEMRVQLLPRLPRGSTPPSKRLWALVPKLPVEVRALLAAGGNRWTRCRSMPGGITGCAPSFQLA